jgi:LacI family transcriptional regulator
MIFLRYYLDRSKLWRKAMMHMATIYDVARLAGVTKSTVSNVINGKTVVREETRARVLAAMAELNYQPSPVARGLKGGKTFVLALLVPTLLNPFYAEIVEVVEREVEKHGYHLLLCIAGKDEEHLYRTLHSLSSRSIDGLLLMAGEVSEQEIQNLLQHGIPVVAAVVPPVKSVPIVDIDYLAVGSLAAQHLLGLGHQRIGVILEHPWHELRLQGVIEILSGEGRELCPEYIRPGSSTFQSGYAAARELLALPLPPTALFATNDLMALGAMQAVIDLGMDVPGQVSIVGVDNITLAEYSRPPLTTIALPRQALGQEAIDLLLRHIDYPQPRSLVTLLLQPEIIIRASTGPCAVTELL